MKTNFFYDCEFLEDGRTIDLISIGIVSDRGQEYYAVNAEMPQSKIREHDWLKTNVWPFLPVASVGNGLDDVLLDCKSPVVKSRRQIASEVRNFITRHSLEWEDNRLWAYYAAYDHVSLAQLFGPMVQMPNGIPFYTNELVQLWRIAGRPEKPEQVSEHHALADAKWNYELYQICMKELK